MRETKCRDCGAWTGEESGMCFMCTEELAYLLSDAALEFGCDPVAAARAAWTKG
jgi:hypothetical protein